MPRQRLTEPEVAAEPALSISPGVSRFRRERPVQPTGEPMGIGNKEYIFRCGEAAATKNIFPLSPRAKRPNLRKGSKGAGNLASGLPGNPGTHPSCPVRTCHLGRSGYNISNRVGGR